jgi:ABC-2 type transport system ATP-binding protein
MIEVSNLRKSFGPIVAVDGLSFEIRQGETFGLLGPNGAGKTTTILMLTGALRPDAGAIAIDGAADPTRVEARRRLGVAPQALALYDELTGTENLAFLGKLYGLSGSRLKERVAWALEFAGLLARGRDRIKTYSGGMKRRLNLACALIHDPAVLFLDEPTVGVDPQSRNHIFAGIEGLARQGRTILYTTHYMEEAEKLCSRVAVMDRGKILALDTVEALIRQYGGQSLIEVELDGAPPPDVPLPAPVEAGRLRFASDKPFEEGARLLAAGVRLGSFKVERPNLEAVFLTLTGRRLRD